MEKNITDHEYKINREDGQKLNGYNSFLNQKTQDFIDQFEKTDIVSIGSSLKFMLITENKADVYPRFSTTTEWDTAAAYSILLGLDIDVL